MTISIRPLVAVASLLLFLGASTPAADATEHPKAPQAVLDRVAEAFPHANITDCDKQGSGDAVVYEVKIIDAGGDKRTLHIGSDGRVLPESKRAEDAVAASNAADRAADRADRAVEKAERASTTADQAVDRADRAVTAAARASTAADAAAGKADRTVDSAERAAGAAHTSADQAAAAADRR